MRLNWPPPAYLWSGLAGLLAWMWVRRKGPAINQTAGIGAGFIMTQLVNRTFGRTLRPQANPAGIDRMTRRKRASEAIEGQHGSHRSTW